MSYRNPAFGQIRVLTPFFARHLGAGGLVPQRVLARRAKAREAQPQGVVAARRLPLHRLVKERHDAVATLCLPDLEPLAGVNVRDRAGVVVIFSQAAPGGARVALRVAFGSVST